MVCKAKRTNGQKCKAQAITGGKVCRVHGGSAPQVKASARLRILAAADPVSARLVLMATQKRPFNKLEPALALAAIKDLLNRAGIVAGAAQEDDAGSGGQMLWDEFIQIHRRRLPAPSDD
jgi:hypothetical protein